MLVQIIQKKKINLGSFVITNQEPSLFQCSYVGFVQECPFIGQSMIVNYKICFQNYRLFVIKLRCFKTTYSHNFVSVVSMD